MKLSIRQPGRAHPLLRCLLLVVSLPAAFGPRHAACAGEPVTVIFDTDIGNDIDDALALGVIHALQSRGACRLLAVTISKDNALCAPFVDLVNHFYGRGKIPVASVRGGATPDDGTYLRPVVEASDAGQLRYPRQATPAQPAPTAVDLLRRTLANQPDGSVVLIVVGFSTNLAGLLASSADQHSPLAGRELVARKVRLLSMMAGMFSASGRHREYNVYVDLPAARQVFAQWPTPIVVSGFEIGSAVKFPATSIEHDFGYVPHHPLAEAYRRYQTMPYDRETWDLTSVLFAVYPDRGYFTLSEPGTISIDHQEITQFNAQPHGQHRYLLLSEIQGARVQEALLQLASQPPDHVESRE